MCCFTNVVDHVGNTRIFARGLEDGYQYIVYAMDYAAATDLAMILPIPTPLCVSEEALRWIDLSDYPEFFDDLHNAIQLSRSLSLEDVSKSLTVHEVGSFEASFVPHQDDFARLDPRFSIPKAIWTQMPEYDDYGFAVFKLKAGEKSVHPMAFAFPRRNPDELFFPTVHVHHNEVEPTADFDHELYYQTPTNWGLPKEDELYWRVRVSALSSLGEYVDLDRAQGIVQDWPGTMISVVGDLPNRDIILSEF